MSSKRPPPASRAAYRRGVDAREALVGWVQDGLISDDLAVVLGATLEDEARDRGRIGVISVLVGVGSLLIGGGLLLFIASHWDEQSPVRRLLLLVAGYLVVVGAAAIADRQRLDTSARALWFLSSIAVGVDVFLVGQIFHLQLNYWQGTLFWMIAALAMGVASPSSAHGLLVIVLGILTLGWLSVPSAELFDQGAFLYDEGGIRALLPLIGLALIGGGPLVADTAVSFLRRPAQLVGGLLIAVPLTVSTFHPEVFGALFKIDLRGFHLFVVAIAVAVLAAALWRERDRTLAQACGVAGALVLLLLPQVTPRGDTRAGFNRLETVSWLAEPFDDSDLLFGIYAGLILAVAVGVALTGKHRDQPVLVNIGLTVVGVLVLAIYIGRIAGALPTSVAVLAGGVLLVAGGVFLERARRDLLGSALP